MAGIFNRTMSISHDQNAALIERFGENWREVTRWSNPDLIVRSTVVDGCLIVATAVADNEVSALELLQLDWQGNWS